MCDRGGSSIKAGGIPPKGNLRVRSLKVLFYG